MFVMCLKNSSKLKHEQKRRPSKSTMSRHVVSVARMKTLPHCTALPKCSCFILFVFASKSRRSRRIKEQEFEEIDGTTAIFVQRLKDLPELFEGKA